MSIPNILMTAICTVAMSALPAVDVAYIYGDVGNDGSIPSSGSPYDQMLLTSTGNKGCSQFRDMVLAEGYTIEQYYDRNTTLNATFLNQFDVVIFGLHQEIWTASEKAALDTWLQNGGGMMCYSDSAAGGHYNQVGSDNPVGQNAVNNIIEAYGMQVTVDQAHGTCSFRAGPADTHPIVDGQLIFEGEGVSPVAVDPTSSAQVLIPFTGNSPYYVAGPSNVRRKQGITITNPDYAAIAEAEVGQGSIVVIFDRQPMWNNGPGSDINERDNKEILRRIVRYLAGAYDAPEPNLPPTLSFATPSAGASFTAPADVAVEVIASDSDGTIDHVDLYVNGVFERRENQAPYEWSLNLPVGSYDLQAEATDDDGAVSIETLSITVDSAPTEGPIDPGTDQLVLHLPFDESAGTLAADVSGFAHNGTLVGSEAGWVTDGRIDGGLSVAGGSYVDVSDASVLNKSVFPERTISTWFRVDDATARQVVVESGGTTRGLNIYFDGGQLYVGGWNTKESGWGGTHLSTAAPADGQWHHVALVLAGGSTVTADALSMYLDGALIATGAGSQLWSHSDDIGIGATDGKTRFHDGTSGEAHGLSGDLDGMRWYNRALSTQEIEWLAEEGAPVSGQVPFSGSPHLVGARIEAEDYDLGGPGIAYFDTTVENQGGAYRADEVDIQSTGDVDGGYNIGWTASGEWLEYTVTVPATGTYLVEVRGAVKNSRTRNVTIEAAGTSTTVAIPSTGAWQTYTTESDLIELEAGTQVIRMSLGNGGLNVNWLQFTELSASG